MEEGWQLAGLVDLERGGLAVSGAFPGLWVPREVEFSEGLLVYPVPPEWRSPETWTVAGRENRDRAEKEFQAWRRGELGPEEVRPLRAPSPSMKDLLAYGWEFKPASPGEWDVVNDLVKLARDPDPVRAAGFAKRWGPLWECARHPGHRWSPRDLNRSDPCFWGHRMDDLCRESPASFVVAARRVKAALDLGAELVLAKEKGPQPERAGASLKELGLDPGFAESATPEILRFLLAQTVNLHLREAAVIPWLAWSRWAAGRDHPRLVFSTGLGFLSLAWLQVALSLSQARDLYVCDGCGRVYVRERGRRRPKRGCRNFCRECEERGAKKQAYELSHPGRRRKNRPSGPAGG